jgi:hypothetical protein
MYSQTVAAQRLVKITDLIREADPTFAPQPTPVELAWERSDALEKLVDDKGNLARPLKPEEERWILNELVLSKASFEYWATRYVQIKTKEAESSRLFPLFESQAIILDRIGKIEEQCVAGERLDGILVAILKARQLGASTLSEAMLGHRAFLYGNTTALIAADTPDQSAFLYNMLERIYDNLPWWMTEEVLLWARNEARWEEAKPSPSPTCPKSAPGRMPPRSTTRYSLPSHAVHELSQCLSQLLEDEETSGTTSGSSPKKASDASFPSSSPGTEKAIRTSLKHQMAGNRRISQRRTQRGLSKSRKNGAGRPSD